jgi:GDP-L-fucose synthase
MEQLISAGARIFVAGHRGLVGSAIVRRLVADGYVPLTRSHDELDLQDADATRDVFATTQPDAVVLAAARVGGILANSRFPVEFLEENLRIQLSVISSAHAVGINRLLFLGSSCIYPKFAAQPISEDALLTGPLEATNEAYAIAKIAGITQVQAYRRQHGRAYISAMPTNLYGPGDNFDLETSHVLPAMIRKFHDAYRTGRDRVELWGTGTPRREFLHVDDLAAACVTLLQRYDSDEPINVGVGADLTIGELATIVASVIGFDGDIVFDASRPDGTPRKVLDVSRIQRLGWAAHVNLRDGIAATYAAWQSAS